MLYRFTRPLTKRLVKDERPAIRAVCAILDAFHFGSPGVAPQAAAPASPTAPKAAAVMASDPAQGAAALVGGTSEAQGPVSCLWCLLTELCWLIL